MTNQNILIAVAKLDGKQPFYCDGKHGTAMHGGSFVTNNGSVYALTSDWYEKYIPYVEDYKPYLTSRDAIIPVICKQKIVVQQEVYRQLFAERFEHSTDQLSVRFTVSLEEIFHKTARDYSVALLKATGKWEE